MGMSADQALDHEVRLTIFRTAAETGSVPQAAEVAAALGLDEETTRAAIRRLAAGRVLFLAPNDGTIWAANPFCAVPSPFRVDARGRRYYGVCIWDALGIPAALGADAVIHARCGDSGEPMTLEVRDGELSRAEGLLHFGVPARRWWENIGFT